jgi:hypothetical protein
MKSIVLLISFFTSSVVVSAAQNISYEQLCSYDKRAYCRKLKPAGKLKEVDPESITILRTYRAVILNESKNYNVDPRAIVGAILAEAN